LGQARSGIGALTATTGGGAAALVRDVQNLVGAIADAGGGTTIMFVANARQVAALKLLAPPGFDYLVVVSPVVPSGTSLRLTRSPSAADSPTRRNRDWP
jgi:hypothetical protein